MSSKNITMAVVIPTKNRPDDLMRAVESVKRQTRHPNEIIVVDQSFTDDIRAKIEYLLKKYDNIKLTYIFNQDLTGLTSAKNLAIKSSESDALLFIDDDIILDEKFIEVLCAIYRKYPELDGVGGLSMLPEHKSSALRRKAALLFQAGPFRDFRAVLQAGYMGDKEIIRTWLLSGGLSSLRREVFEKVQFNDSLPGASPIEDFDFYSRARIYFQFALAPAARALHNISSISRQSLRLSFERKCSGFSFIFSRYIRKTPLNWTAFLWKNVGISLDAVIATVLYRTFDPIIGVYSAWYNILVKGKYT